MPLLPCRKVHTMSPAPAHTLPAPLGTRLAVGGHNLWIHRSGTGGPAIVILPGGGAIGLDYLNIHEGVARRATGVVYDRAGTGWSDPADLPRTAARVVAELRGLLGAAGVPAPYLFVGHSLGGAYARHYAQCFPHEVAALVLIDPLHEDSPKYWPEATRKGQEQTVAMLAAEAPAALLDAYRGVFEEKLWSWPVAIREAVIARHLAAWRIGLLEGLNVDAVCEELRRGGPTPDVPLVVITAMGIDPAQRAFAPDPVQRQINEGKHTLNELIARSVPRGRHVVVEDAAHAWITMDRPDVVLQAVDDLRSAAPQASDLTVLRSLADDGNEEAEARLTELALQRGDLEQLRRLADDGNEAAAGRLTELARDRGDIEELRRLADEGNDEAERELARLIRGFK
jgi:pimeloyl-ACP methyl ester carboxylesterase